MERQIISREAWDEFFKNLREDTYVPYQEEVIHHEILDLPCTQVPVVDNGPIYSIDDPDSEW